MADASCGGTFMTKNEDEAWELFDTLSDNSMYHASVFDLTGPPPRSKEKWCLRVGTLIRYSQ